jgi:hypothetical protein
VKKLYIADDDMLDLRDLSKEMVYTAGELKKVEHRCPYCGGTIYYPLIASKSGIEAVEKSLEAIASMADRTGLSTAALAALYRDMLHEIQKRAGAIETTQEGPRGQ